MRRVITLFLFLCFTVTTVHAGGPGGGATEFTQLLNNAELLKQVSQLSQQIQNQITMIQDLKHNTLMMPDQLFRDVRSIYTSISGIIRR